MQSDMADVSSRKYLYGLVVAAIPVLVALGVALPGGVDIWLYLAAAVLGLPTTGVAFANAHKQEATAEENNVLRSEVEKAGTLKPDTIVVPKVDADRYESTSPLDEVIVDDREADDYE